MSDTVHLRFSNISIYLSVHGKEGDLLFANIWQKVIDGEDTYICEGVDKSLEDLNWQYLWSFVPHLRPSLKLGNIYFAKGISLDNAEIFRGQFNYLCVNCYKVKDLSKTDEQEGNKKHSSSGTLYTCDMVKGKVSKKSMSESVKECAEECNFDNNMFNLGFKSMLELSPNSSEYIPSTMYLCKKLRSLPPAGINYFKHQFQKANEIIGSYGNFDVNDYISDEMECAVITGVFDDKDGDKLSISVNGICGEGNFVDIRDETLDQVRFFKFLDSE